MIAPSDGVDLLIHLLQLFKKAKLLDLQDQQLRVKSLDQGTSLFAYC